MTFFWYSGDDDFNVYLKEDKKLSLPKYKLIPYIKPINKSKYN